MENQQVNKTPEEIESEFIFDKKITCVVCDKEFKTKVLKNTKARRLGSDIDLRPRFKDIDILKYNICSCPNCGYSALHKQFERMSSTMIANVKETVCVKMLPVVDRGELAYSYDEAIKMYDLALACCESKLAKDGEKGYLYLNLAWLYRGKKETCDAIEKDEIREMAKKQMQGLEDENYEKAYEHLSKALMNESLPIMGLDQSTMEYLLAYMAYHFGKYEVAAKFISSVLSSSLAPRSVKDKALELKDMVVKTIKAKKAAAAAAAAKK